jgi:hypothetical protein
MSQKHTFWERPGVVEVLRAAAAPGIYTASELATLLSERFNVDISRNAVMGKCWREGIPLRGRRGPEPKAPSVPKPHKPQAIINEYLKAPRIKRSALLKCDEPEPRGDVADGCRWLHGPAEDRLFCGAPTVRFGISWCHHHCARVWNPATPAQVAKFAKFVTWRAA